MMIKTIKAIIVLFSCAVFMVSCSSDEDTNTTIILDETLYNLAAVSDATVFGSVKISNLNTQSIRVEIQLSGVTSGSHPAAIYMDNAVDGNTVVLTLNNVNSSGYSSTTFTTLDDATAITYDELIAFDGHIKVHMSTTDATLIARGDIGQNKLTGVTRTYALGSNTDPAIDGLVIFAERENEETLVVVQLDGTTTGTHPSAIYDNDLATGGVVTVSLNDVDGVLGEGRTNISQLDDTTAITYDELTAYNGHVLVNLSSSDTSIIAEGNIGSN